VRPLFWSSKRVKQIYQNYVNHMLNRVNTYTGVAYKNEPSIMIWEIMNEPRFGPWDSPNGVTQVRNWLKDAAVYIKSIDKHHLVGTGEEGFLDKKDSLLKRKSYPFNAATGEGVSYTLNAQIKEIDVMGFHMWPFQWSLWESSDKDYGKDMIGEYPDLSKFADDWVKEHKRIADKFNKPVYLGEFGFQILRRKGSDISDRDKIIKSVYKAAVKYKINGLAFWNLTPSDNYTESIYKGKIIRKTLLQSQYTDWAIPHDLDFKFDIYYPHDKSTYKIIKKYTKIIIGI